MENKQFRNQLIKMLSWEGAHSNLDHALNDMPPEVIGVKVSGIDYTIWQLAEHIRITQADILNFCTNSRYVSKSWPDSYWPLNYAPHDISDWENTVKQIKEDRKNLVELVKDPQTDLMKPIPHGKGQNIFREIVLVIDHNSYHTGQIIMIRKMLGVWEPVMVNQA